MSETYRLGRAETFARTAEEAGWETKIKNDPERNRSVVHARRGQEQFSFAWVDGKFEKGRHKVAGTETPWSNVKAAIRMMQQPEDVIYREADTGCIIRLPFDIEEADDKVVLAALADHTVTWRNHLTGGQESGRTPRGGLHFKIEQHPVYENNGERIVTFADQYGGGFRSFALSQLLEVE